MKIELNEKMYHGQLDATKLIQVELDTGKSFGANAKDPGVTFVCSAIAAAISEPGKVFSMLDVSKLIDPTKLPHYSEIVSELLEEILTPKVYITKEKR